MIVSLDFVNEKCEQRQKKVERINVLQPVYLNIFRISFFDGDGFPGICIYQES